MKKRTFCEEVKKIIYTKGKTTYCKLDCALDIFPESEDVILPWDMCKKLESKYKIKYTFGNQYEIHIEAAATCQEGDTFDEKKGRTIAYSKAQRKLYYLIYRMFRDIEPYLFRYTNDALNARKLFMRYFKREHNFLSKL